MPATIDSLVDTPFMEGFVVMGNNWKKEVGIPPEDLDLTQILMEAATRGVESFLRGEYEMENTEKPVGFGATIVVRHKKSGKSWSLPAPDVLANAGAYKDAKEVQDIINKSK